MFLCSNLVHVFNIKMKIIEKKISFGAVGLHKQGQANNRFEIADAG